MLWQEFSLQSEQAINGVFARKGFIVLDKMFVDVIEQMSGFKDKHVRNESPGNFQLDVNYQGRKFDFKRELYRGLKAQGILFDTQQAKGNRFLLFKKGTDNPFGAININGSSPI